MFATAKEGPGMVLLGLLFFAPYVVGGAVQMAVGLVAFRVQAHPYQVSPLISRSIFGIILASG
jgi:hypothetical protein